MIEGIGKYSSGTNSYNGKAASMQTNQFNFQSRLMDESFNSKHVLAFQQQEKNDSGTTKPKRSFDGLDVLGPSAPDEVKDAWKRAEKESGVNGYGMNSEGKFTQITALFAMSIEKMVNGSGQDILGNTISSAVEAVRKALERLGIPQSEEEKKEQLFYEAFLRILG